MPITICKKHGETGSPEMCEHLRADLNDGIVSPFFPLPIRSMRMCEECFKKHDVQALYDHFKIDKTTIERIQSGKVLEYQMEIMDPPNKEETLSKIIKKIYFKLHEKSGFYCDDCIDEMRLKQLRQNNLPLPFEPFENTLMKEEDERVLKLQDKLEKHLNPEKLPFCKKLEKHWSIEFGSLRTVFTITIHGVEIPKEQQHVLDIINDFFQNIPEKQRKIIFKKPLNWTSERHATHAEIIAEFTVK